MGKLKSIVKRVLFGKNKQQTGDAETLRELEEKTKYWEEAVKRNKEIEADNANLIKALEEKTKHWEDAVKRGKEIEGDNANLIKALEEKTRHWEDAVRRGKEIETDKEKLIKVLDKKTKYLEESVKGNKKPKENISLFKGKEQKKNDNIDAQNPGLVKDDTVNKRRVVIQILRRIRRFFNILFFGRVMYDRLTKLDNIRDIKNSVININKNISIYRNQIIKSIFEASTVHETNTRTFSKYQGIFKGRDIVIVGSGPTLNFFEPIENAINMGVNTTFLKDNLRIDYLFVTDNYWLNEEKKELLFKYQCKKFLAFHGSDYWNLSLDLRNIPDYEEYCVYYSNVFDNPIHIDITKSPLANLGSTIFSVMQFALWTQPKRIFIVGCDCTVLTNGLFNGVTIERRGAMGDERFIKGWGKIKKFKDIYYPEIELVSVNPVGLKGMFKDMFTEKYYKETYSNDLVYLNGYFEDGWVGKSSRYCILSGQGGKLTISGYYNKEITPELSGKIIINNEVNSIYVLNNKFKFIFNVRPETITYINIEMDFEFDAELPDVRKLCFLLEGISSS